MGESRRIRAVDGAHRFVVSGSPIVPIGQSRAPKAPDYTAKEKRCFTYRTGVARVEPYERACSRVIGVDAATPDGERSTGSTTTRSSRSTARSSCSGRTTSGRSSTTGRAGSARMRSSAATRRSRQARCTPSRSGTGSSRATASRRSACSAGCLPRRSSSGGAATRPAGGTRRTINVASICVPIATQVPHAAGLAWGLRLKGSDAVAVTIFGDGATSEGAFHEGANIAAVMKAPLVLLCNNNQWAISTPLSAQTAAARLADKAIGYGMPAIRVDGHDVLAVYEAVREGVARARAGDGPTFVEAVTYRGGPARDRRRPEPLHRPRARRGGARARLRRDVRGVPRAARRARRRARGPRCRKRRSRPCGRGSRRPRTSLRRPGARLRARVRGAAADARPRPRRAPAGARPMSATAVATRELLLVEAVNDALHVELARDDTVMVLGEDVGRARRRLPRDGRAARPVRPRPLRRHAALRGRDPRRRGRALHGRLAPGRRDAVRRLLLPVPRPADHARRPVPLAHRRPDGLPARDPHALRRRRAGAGAPRRLAGDVLRAHPGREGRGPGDAGGREGPPRGGDPRSGSRRRARAEARLPHRARLRARGRARRRARATRASPAAGPT